MNGKSKEQTGGEYLANSFSPFLDPRNAHKSEIVKNMASAIDKNLTLRENLIVQLLGFIQGEKIKIDGLTYTKGVNDSSFVDKIKSTYDIK